MTEYEDPALEFDALQSIIAALRPLDREARSRIFEAAAILLRIDADSKPLQEHRSASAVEARPGTTSYSTDMSMSPKEFLFDKQPRTDVERIAALAFYLTHFRDTAHFKTLDLSKLNTEAAQPKFSNTANSANNAVKQGYLVPSSKGQRQLSAAGERFVNALPDREAARNAMTSAKPRRKTRRSTATKKPPGS